MLLAVTLFAMYDITCMYILILYSVPGLGYFEITTVT